MTHNIIVPLKLAEHAQDLPLPRYMTPAAAGLDLHAAVNEPVTVAPGSYAAIPTGVHIALPEGFEAQIRPRSGLALKYGVTLLNTPGTIDADYRGEIRVIVVNFGHQPFTINRGDRIAQMVVSPVCQVSIQLVDDIDDTSRGSGGFGHTGV